MALPKSRDEFIEYCLRKLGQPVIEVNIDEDQTNDRVDEALLFYQTYHYDAVEHIAITYEITQADLDNQYITMPDSILSVTKLIYDGESTLIGQFGQNLWHGMSAIAHDIGFGMGACRSGTSYYTMMMNYLAEMEFAFGVNSTIEFQYKNHRLYINGDWNKLKVGGLLAFDTYRNIDPEENPSVWSDRWLQEYATCLIGAQWGANLSKYTGVQLPGGIELDGDKIYDRYNDWKERLEEEMITNWEEPVHFIMG